MSQDHVIMIQRVFATEDDIAKGLMDDYNPLLPSMGALFIFPTPQHATFWMKNTPCSLDIIFIRSDYTIAKIYEGARPFDETHIPSEEVVTYVVETLAGYCTNNGLKINNKVSFQART